ncbi:hypothetical protein VSR68_35605 [Paraburkholderia phymatum]|uniref:hypothetical protein n=1 Tax=Paraburkholderia phymatum TaxID=148447 RepID=UPI00316B6E82
MPDVIGLDIAKRIFQIHTALLHKSVLPHTALTFTRNGSDGTPVKEGLQKSFS